MRRCGTHERSAPFIERVVATSRRFEPRVRVGFFLAEYDPRESVLEPGALGSYEVVGCDRVEADERPRFEVRLRRLADV